MTKQSNGRPHRVVIVGGGFGGLYAAQALRRAPVRITLIDRRNFHLFQPLLYQVATGALSPANIASPLRGILNRQKNVEVLMADVVGFDLGPSGASSRGRADESRVQLGPAAEESRVQLAPTQCVMLRDGAVPFDSVIVAAGASHNYFGHDDWAGLAPGLKTIEDATRIRHRILGAFEQAERETEPDRLREWLTFVVVGGGATGVELAGALAEIARDTLRYDFRRINPADARILLLEGGPRILPAFPPELSSKATESLRKLGVTVQTDTIVTSIQEDAVAARRRDAVERIPARTVLWAAGVQASPLARALTEATGAALDRAGRVVVSPDLTVPGYPDVFVIGDMAHFAHSGKGPLPGVATVAMQQGRYVARLIRRRLVGKDTSSFVYRDPGNLATIGRAAAVADLRWVRFSGYPAWLAWLFVHLINLIEFQNRLLVLMQWAWNYATRGRSARLITGETDAAGGHQATLATPGADERKAGAARFNR